MNSNLVMLQINALMAERLQVIETLESTDDDSVEVLLDVAYLRMLADYIRRAFAVYGVCCLLERTEKDE